MTSPTRSVWTSSRGGGFMGAGAVLAGWSLWDGDMLSATIGFVLLAIGIGLVITERQRGRKATARPE